MATKITMEQAEADNLIEQIKFYGENAGYFRLISDLLLPASLAYMAVPDRGTFGTVSDQEFLNQCQILQHLLLDLKAFTDKYQ